MNEARIAFIIVDLGELSHAAAGVKLLDISDAIDAVEGARTESFGSFPKALSPQIMSYVEAANSLIESDDEPAH